MPNVSFVKGTFGKFYAGFIKPENISSGSLKSETLCGCSLK